MKYLPIFLALLFSASPLPAETTKVSCLDSKVIVFAETKTICENICDAVRLGDVFIKSIDLNLPDKLTITLFKELPKNGQHHSLGYYDSRSNEIRLLDFETALAASTQSQPSFGVMMSPTIWRSFIIHELAHAAAQKKFASGVSTCTASEYIAAVVQISTLPLAELKTIMRNYPEVAGFDKKEEITMAYYMLDPSKFMLNAYLHYSKPENGLKFIRRLLSEGLPDI